MIGMKASFPLSCCLCVGKLLLIGTLASAEARNLPPYLNWSEDPQTTVNISWERDQAGRGVVHYGETPALGMTVRGPENRRRHVITLRDLQPGTRYYYQVESTDGFESDLAYFRTAPGPDGSFTVLLRGDPQQHSSVGFNWVDGTISYDHLPQLATIATNMPDFHIIVGDLVWDNHWHFWEDWFNREAELLAHMPLMPCVGNHEVFTVPHDATHFMDLFALPERPAGRRYFAYTVGNARFIALNSEYDVAGQNEWLAIELQAAANDPDILWTFLYWHRTVYTWTQKHGRYTPAYDNWVPIITQYGADIVFMGHNHLYEQSGPFRGVRYITTGGGGGDLTLPASSTGANVVTTCFHFVEMEIGGDALELRAIREDGLRLDTLNLTNPGRIVQVSPAFPLPGETAVISYDAEQGPLAGASTIRIHLGIDAFTGPVLEEPMTLNTETGRWEYEVVVPVTATQRLAFVFNNGENQWHSNYTWGSPSRALDWQALLGRVAFEPAHPVAGQPVTIRYYHALGRISDASAVHARVGYNEWHEGSVADYAMTHDPATQTYEVTLTVPDYARRLHVVFHDGDGGWDDNVGLQWEADVAGATAATPFGTLPVVAPGSPDISEPPESDANNPGDNMDFNLAGGPVRTFLDKGGFGDFGEVYFNYDADHLYIGAIGSSLGGSNNVMVLFLGVDTLPDGAFTLSHKAGSPNTLDNMDNLVFTDPMNIAILLGDEYGDGTFASFTYSGYDFGQGLFYIGTNSSDYVPVAGARLSQFDGEGQIPTTSGNDDGNRFTTRWESSIPWASLNAPDGIASLGSLSVAGVVAGRFTSGQNRYLSGAYIGETGYGARDSLLNHQYNVLTIRPHPVLLPHGDYDGDGLPNYWKHQHFGSAIGPGPTAPAGNSSLTIGEAYAADVDPNDPAAGLPVWGMTVSEHDRNWIVGPTSPARLYNVQVTTNLVAADWVSYTNLPGTGGDLQFPEINASGSAFYRYQISVP